MNLAQLATAPERHGGCRVKVEGYCVVDRDVPYLFPAKDVVDGGLYSCAVEVVLTDGRGRALVAGCYRIRGNVHGRDFRVDSLGGVEEIKR